MRVWLEPLDCRVHQYHSGDGFRVPHRVAAHDEAAKRVADQDAAPAYRNPLQHLRQFVHDSLERPRAGRNIAPGKAGAIVRARSRELRKCGLHHRPTNRRRRDAGLEEYWWTAGAAAQHVQPMAANVDQFTGSEKAPRRRMTAEALVEHTRRDKRGEYADDQDQLLDVRGARCISSTSSWMKTSSATPRPPLSITS